MDKTALANKTFGYTFSRLTDRTDEIEVELGRIEGVTSTMFDELMAAWGMTKWSVDMDYNGCPTCGPDFSVIITFER